MDDDTIILHRSRSYSDDFETDQAIRFEAIVLEQNLCQIDEQILATRDKLDELIELRTHIEKQLTDWQMKYGRVVE